jgi:orotidine-5'-phosphate decarboxylase
MRREVEAHSGAGRDRRGERHWQVADSVGDLVDAIKINWPIVLSTSPEIITRLSRSSEVICDFQSGGHT